MSSRRTGDVHQQPEAQQEPSNGESRAIAADRPGLEEAKFALRHLPSQKLIDVVADLVYHENPDVQHATWDAILAAAG